MVQQREIRRPVGPFVNLGRFWLPVLLMVLLLVTYNNSVLSAGRREVIVAADYQIRPNTGRDVTGAVQRLIHQIKERGHPVTLVFAPGQYDFYYNTATRAPYYISNTSGKEELDTEVKTIAILLKDIDGLTIEGKGALFMLHGKMTSLVADNCNELTIHNLQFDYARPTMSEFTVTSVNADYIDVKVNSDSWYHIKDSTLYWYGENWDAAKTPLRLFTCVYTPADSALHFVNAGWTRLTQSKRALQLSKNHVRFYHPDKMRASVGDVYTVRDITRDEVGMFLLHSKEIKLDGVQMHFMHGLGIVSQFCTDIYFNHLRCAPRPETGRICASTADMAHFSGCNGHIKIENSFFSGAHDDPINIHGTHLRIVKQLADNKVIVRFMHHQTYGIQAYDKGDSVDFISAKTLLPYATRVVTAYKRLGEYEIELQLNSPLPAGIDSLDCLENTTRTPAVVIRNNWFQRTTTRGLLVTTRKKVLIEGNTWFKTGMSAILIADDANNWYESGLVRDMTIKNNTFIGCGGPVIHIAPENQVIVPGKFVHHNIRITGNLFKVQGGSILAARSVDGLYIQDNKILPLRAPLTADKGSLISIDACSDIVIQGNILPKGVISTVQTAEMQSPGMKIKSDWQVTSR